MYNTSARKRFDDYLNEINEEISFTQIMKEAEEFQKQMVSEMELNNKVSYPATHTEINYMEAKNMVYCLMMKIVDMKSQQISKNNRLKAML